MGEDQDADRASWDSSLGPSFKGPPLVSTTLKALQSYRLYGIPQQHHRQGDRSLPWGHVVVGIEMALWTGVLECLSYREWHY